MANSKLIGHVKYGLSAGSKIFTGIAVFNMIRSFLAGGGYGVSGETLDKLVVTFVCVASSIVFDEVKVAAWIRYILSYITVTAIIQGYTLLIGHLTGDIRAENHINALLWTTAVFAIVMAFDRASRRYKDKKSEGKSDE